MKKLPTMSKMKRSNEPANFSNRMRKDFRNRSCRTAPRPNPEVRDDQENVAERTHRLLGRDEIEEDEIEKNVLPLVRDKMAVVQNTRTSSQIHGLEIVMGH